MSLSLSETIELTCPACGQDFAAEAWALVDAVERPDLAEALRDGTLNVVVCPHCGNQTAAGVALLFHDPASRRVYFAVPPASAEHAWRERAQELLYALVGGLPEEQRLPYLGDVQVEQDVDGVRRALLRRQRARRAPPAGGARPIERAAPEAPQSPAAATSDEASLVELVQQLLAVDSPEGFAAIVGEHPVLLSAEAGAAMAQLAEIALSQGQGEVASALTAMRAELARMRRGAGAGEQEAAEGQTASPSAGGGPLAPDPRSLSDRAYQALLMAASVDELRATVGDYPALLEPWADADLYARVESALDAGDERLAVEIEERREALAALRDELAGQGALSPAIAALLHADGEDALAETLNEHPILLTDAAQQALHKLAASARARGDEQLAAFAAERSAMLHKVREGLEAG